MSENDAEWIDVDREFGRPSPTRPPGPNRPPPRPRSSTYRPWGSSPPDEEFPRPRIPNGRRRPTPGRDNEDPGTDPPPKGANYSATTISVSVVGVIFLLAVVALLLYLFVLRKKLRKVQKSQSDSQFCLRVEDVTHLDIDDSAKLYVNTTDLQKLVSSVRIKNKKLPPPLPFNNDFPDVVNVGRPPVPLPSDTIQSNATPFSQNSSLKLQSSDIDAGVCNYTYNQTDSADNIYSNVSSTINPTEYINSEITIARPAPPPPRLKSSNPNVKSSVHSFSITDEDKISNISKLPPPVLPKPTVNPSHFQTLEDGIKPKNEKPCIMISKPKISPPNPPSKPKPSTGALKPMLPRLKMNLTPQVKHQESEFSTPDTAESYLSNTTDVDRVEPELLSVKDKRAFLEGVLAGETLKRGS